MTARVCLTAPHVLVGSLCAGFSIALVAEARSAAFAVVAATLALGALAAPHGRTTLLALSLAALGWWWASVRLEQLDASVLVDRVGSAAPARVEVTGPARRSEFAIRVPVDVLRFGDVAVDEPARLDLPPERAPPQGAILDLVASVRRPRPAESSSTFDEATYLRREGVHVVLHASRFAVVGRRGGLGGVADALRRRLAASIAPGVAGERRAVVAGVVLGNDDGLARDLREDFRASGLYHLLSKFKLSQQVEAPRRPAWGVSSGGQRLGRLHPGAAAWPERAAKDHAHPDLEKTHRRARKSRAGGASVITSVIATR